jgi:hypothetical protein
MTMSKALATIDTIKKNAISTVTDALKTELALAKDEGKLEASNSQNDSIRSEQIIKKCAVVLTAHIKQAKAGTSYGKIAMGTKKKPGKLAFELISQFHKAYPETSTTAEIQQQLTKAVQVLVIAGILTSDYTK